MTRVIVHAGYHKTGTTSLQDFMSSNRKALADYCRYYGKVDFLAAGAHARIYAQKPFPWRLWRFRRSFRRFLNTVDAGGTIVLSRETFSGGMPGHRRMGGGLMFGYSGPAEKLARVITAELRRKFGQDTDITFFYTTRDRETWIKSVHGHLLRSIKLDDDFKTFRARFPDLNGPAQEAAIMAKALAPIPVVTAALEDHADDPAGPATGLLDLLGVPENVRAQLTPAKRSNTGQPPEIQEQFRRLNAQALSKKALRTEKERILRAGATQ